MPACVHVFRPRHVAAAVGDRVARSPLRDVVARADLRVVGQRADAQSRAALSDPAGEISAIGSPGSGSPTIGRRTPYADGVADEDAAEQRLRVVGEHQLGVGLVDGVVDHHLEAVRRGAHRVAEAGDVDAEQLELGRHVGAGELRGAAEQPVGDDLGDRVARGRPGRSSGPRPRRPHRSRRCWGRGVAQDRSVSTPPRSATSRPASRASSSRGRTPAAKTTSAGVDGRPVAQRHPHRVVVGGPPDGSIALCRRILSVPTPACTVMPSSAIIRPSSAPPASSTCWAISRGAISTTCGVQPERAQRVGGLQAEQTAADHHADRRWPPSRVRRRRRGSRRGRRACGRRSSRQVVARHRRHERVRAGGQHQRVVGDARSPSAVTYCLGGPVDRGDAAPSRSSTRSSPA